MNMFEKYMCEEAKKGNCKIDCSHRDPHSFYEGFCNDTANCPEKDRRVKCIELSEFDIESYREKHN
jgi:hypothetical protein